MKKLIKDLLVLEKDLPPKTILSYKILSNISPKQINNLLSDPNKNKNFIATIGTTIDFGTILNNLDYDLLEQIASIISIFFNHEEYLKLEILLKIYNELYYKLTEKIMFHPLAQEPIHLNSIKPLAQNLDEQLITIINSLPNNSYQKLLLIELYNEIERIKKYTMTKLFETYTLPNIIESLQKNNLTLGIYGLYEYTHELAKAEANLDHTLDTIYQKATNIVKATPSNTKNDFLTTYDEVKNAQEEYTNTTRKLKCYLNSDCSLN